MTVAKVGDFVGSLYLESKLIHCPILKVAEIRGNDFSLVWADSTKTDFVKESGYGYRRWVVVSDGNYKFSPPSTNDCDCYRCCSPLVALALEGG